MTVWLLSNREPDTVEFSPEVRDGDRVVRPAAQGFEVGVVHRDQQPPIEWVGEIERSMLPVDRLPGPDGGDLEPGHADLPEVEAVLHGLGTSSPGEGGLPGRGGPKPPA